MTKYPRAAGAALYVNKAFREPFVTFMVAFAVMASGSRRRARWPAAFGGDYLASSSSVPTVLVALGFMVVVAAINSAASRSRCSVNIGLTSIELGGLLLIIVIALARARRRRRRRRRARSSSSDGAVRSRCSAAPALAFYALIGFEDSVNVAEETKDPQPRLPARAVRRAAASPG